MMMTIRAFGGVCYGANFQASLLKTLTTLFQEIVLRARSPNHLAVYLLELELSWNYFGTRPDTEFVWVCHMNLEV